MDMSNGTTTYGFLCGADMEPGKIRRHALTSESRFVDIGAVPATSMPDLGLPLPDADEIWGMVVTLPTVQAAAHAPGIAVALRSGKSVQAVILTDADSFGTPSEALTEAYYWELPRAWREALAELTS